LLLSPAPPGDVSVTEEEANLLKAFHAKSLAESHPLRLLWHTFERDIFRPVDMDSGDLRRGWFNDVAPVPSAVTQTTFRTGEFGNNVLELLEISFLIDQNATITILATALEEPSAVANLDMARVKAAISGL